MKRITILRRCFLERSHQGGWFNPVQDIKIVIDLTDKKIQSTLKELNKTYRSNFYKIWGDYKVSNNESRKEFIEDYMKYRSYYKNEEIKELSMKILKEIK